jgi:hypothetical protein
MRTSVQEETERVVLARVYGLLALVSLLQYAENLSDRHVADAVRGWIDWNYALGLELGDPGFDSTVKSAIQC